MRNPGIALSMAAVLLLGSTLGVSQNADHQGQGLTIVTVLPKHDGDSNTGVAGKDLSVKVNGSQGQVTSWKPLQSPAYGLELVILIDSSAVSSLRLRMDEIALFIKGLPPGTKVAVAYMASGSAIFSIPLSTDLDKVANAVRMPAGSAGSSGTPYICLSDLAKHWPSQDRAARREVVMVSDGTDNYQENFDPSDPYVVAAIGDSLRAGIVVYPVYWQNEGHVDKAIYAVKAGQLDRVVPVVNTGNIPTDPSPNTMVYENSAGQSLLLELAQATGGKNYWVGMSNPVSFTPFFKDLNRRLRNQFVLEFNSRLDGKGQVENMKVKLSASGAEVIAAQQVFVFPAAAAPAPAKN